MKRFIAKYMLYIYLNFIKNDDLDDYKLWAYPIIKTLVFIHNIYIWIASLVFFPIFVIDMIVDYRVDVDKELSKIIKNYQK